MKEITKKQRKVLDFIQWSLDAGEQAPTLVEISKHFGFKSDRAAVDHINALKRKGFLESEPNKARSLRVVSPLLNLRASIAHIPIFGSIPAGFASDDEQTPDGCISVDVKTIGFTPSKNTFALIVVGDSMTGACICDGDIVILEHGPDPLPGQIVAARIDRKNTLKTFILRNGKPYLRAENKKYPDLIPCEELLIDGVFRALVRRGKSKSQDGRF